MSFNPKNPSKYRGTDKTITFFVTRDRSPTGTDYRQPETGRLYTIGTVWQTGKSPTTGCEGDLWILSKIVANVAYWVQISSGVTPSAGILTLSDTVGTLTYPTVGGNMQLEGTAGQIDILSDPGNNKIVFSLPGGSGAVDSFAVPSGTSPVVPDVNGLITLTAGSGVTITGGLNTYEIGITGVGTVTSVSGTADRITISGTATDPIVDIASTYVGQTSIATLGTVTTGTWNGDTITEGYGGTNQTTYAEGDILYASGVNTLAKLTAGSNSEVLTLAGGVPTWAANSTSTKPSFQAQLTAAVLNVTGDGTDYTVVFNNEIFDTTGDFNTTTGIFTAPSNGIYMFAANVLCSQVSSVSFTEGTITLITTARNYTMAQFAPTKVYSDNGSGSLQCSFPLSVICQMSATDTAYIKVRIGPSGGKTVDVESGGSTDPRTFFSGAKIS